MRTAGGDTATMTVTARIASATVTGRGSQGGGENGRTNDRGEAKRPMKRAWEKFRVARVERAAPRRRREKQWMRVIERGDTVKTRLNVVASMAGVIRVAAMKVRAWASDV